MLYSIVNSNSMKILSTSFIIILSIYFVLIILMVNLIRIKAQECQGINYPIETCNCTNKSDDQIGISLNNKELTKVPEPIPSQYT